VASTKPGMRIQAVRRAKPDVQRLAQALIEIAMSQAEVVVDETDDLVTELDRRRRRESALRHGLVSAALPRRDWRLS
jgi:hypothetical protein